MITVIIFTVLIVVFAIISGIANAVADLSSEGKLKGNPNYWIKSVSAENKTHYNKEWKRYIMSTILVMFTDGWHLMNNIHRVSAYITAGACGYMVSKSWWWLFSFLVSYSIFFSFHHLFHDTLNIFKQQKFHK